jgi:hypothetical protein
MSKRRRKRPAIRKPERQQERQTEKRFYKIHLAPLITYTTYNLQAAVAIARGIAIDTGRCALEVRNESGGGYISMYGKTGAVEDRRCLNEAAGPV